MASRVCGSEYERLKIILPAATALPNSACMRAKLLGLPTSIAFERVGMEGLGSNLPVCR